MIAVNKSLNCTFLKSGNNIVEEIYVQLIIDGNKHIFGTIYIPPHTSLDIYKKHHDTIDDLFSSYNPASLTIIGDYNIPKVTWQNDNIGTTDLPRDIHKKQFIEKAQIISNCCNLYDMVQLNDVANANSEFLDLCLTTFRSSKIELNLDPIVNCDVHHPSLNLFLTVSDNNTHNIESTAIVFDFRKAHFELITRDLALTDWSFLNCNFIDLACNLLYKTIEPIFEKHIPKRTLSRENNKCNFDFELKKLLQLKRKAHFQFKSTGSIDDKAEFSKLRAQCKKLIRSKDRAIVDKVELSITFDIKSFYNYT